MTPYYDQDGITIYHGDCADVLPAIDRVDLIVTDPPYGIGASAGVGKYGREKWTKNDPKWDAAPPSSEIMDVLRRVSALQIIWGMNYYSLPPTRKYFVWDKGAGFKGRDFAECELAWCSWDGNAEIFVRDPLAMRDYEGKQHPTMKPVNLMRWCIQRAPQSGTICDPFMGSGTTLIAARDLGIPAIGIEINERYCEIAVKRLSQTVLTL